MEDDGIDVGTSKSIKLGAWKLIGDTRGEVQLYHNAGGGFHKVDGVTYFNVGELHYVLKTYFEDEDVSPSNVKQTPFTSQMTWATITAFLTVGLMKFFGG